MEVKDLAPFVIILLLVGMITSIGVLTMDKFSLATRVNTDIGNETVAFTAGAGVAAKDYLVSVTGGTPMLANGTAVAVTINSPETSSKALTLGAPYAGEDQTVYLGYTHKVATATSGVMDSGLGAVGSITKDWMALITVIGILALVLGMTIAGFSYFGRRR